MQEFIAENPEVAMTIGGILASGLAGFAVLCWTLLREQAGKTETRLSRAIDKLEATMNKGMEDLTSLIDRMDTRHVTLTDHIYDRIEEVDRKVSSLKAEHDNRNEHCPGAMALNQLLGAATHIHKRRGEG